MHHTWYYVLLVVVHVYFLLEYILRLMSQKYVLKYLRSLESILELVTTVPFLISYVVLGDKSNVTQFFVMFTQTRLFNYGRVTGGFQETMRQLIHIAIDAMLVMVMMALTLQFIENRHNF